MGGGSRDAGRWKWARRGVALLFLGALVAAARGEFDLLQGGLLGTRLADVVTFSDPLAALEALAAGGDLGGAWWGALLVGGLAIILGPVFCGWLCPIGLAFDLEEEAQGW